MVDADFKFIWQFLQFYSYAKLPLSGDSEVTFAISSRKAVNTKFNNLMSTRIVLSHVRTTLASSHATFAN